MFHGSSTAIVARIDLSFSSFGTAIAPGDSAVMSAITVYVLDELLCPHTRIAYRTPNTREFGRVERVVRVDGITIPITIGGGCRSSLIYGIPIFRAGVDTSRQICGSWRLSSIDSTSPKALGVYSYYTHASYLFLY